MRNGYRILDADRHVIEPVEMWTSYLDPEHRSRAPYFEELRSTESMTDRMARLGAKGLLPLTPRLMLEGEPVMHKLGERARVELAVARNQRAGMDPGGLHPESQLRHMDKSGIDLGFLFPTYTHYLVNIDGMDPALAAAFARAYNSWLHDYCARAPDRLFGVGVLSLHDPAAMLAELERVASFGWKAVVLRPNPVKGRLLSDPAYEPFWAMCERRSIAVAIHEGSHARLPTAGADRFETRFAQHACSHPMEQMMALLALIEGGVLERHPLLRVALLEAGCGWLPYWLWRLDRIEYDNLAGEVEEHVKMEPSAYFRRQCFIAIEPGEPYLPRLLPELGEDNLLFGTDYPHLDHDAELLDEVFTLGEELPENVLRKLLWDNPSRFYGIDG